MKRFTLLLPLLLGTGCVSQTNFDELKRHDQELAWKLEISDKAQAKLDSEKKMIARELELSREDGKVLREKLAFANDQVKDTKSQCDEELKARLAELQAKAPSKQEITPWGGVVLESGILFAKGKSELSPEGEKALSGIVEALTSPKYEGWLVELAGHTDSDPVKQTATSFRDNHDLSAKRSNSVRRYLIAHGVPSTRLYLSGWGESRPLQSESTAEGKAANRRVEIRLHRDTESSLPAAAKPDQAETKPASAPRTDKPVEKPAEKPSEAKSDEAAGDDGE
jgi:chemotaxis protein MotB